LGPCFKEEEDREGGWPIPVRGVAGGEGQGAREDQWFKAHLLVCLKGWIKGWRRLAGDGALHGGGGVRRRRAPVREWRREVAG